MHTCTYKLPIRAYKKGYNVQKDVTLSPSLSGFVTMCMVRKHISTVYKVTAASMTG